MRTFNYRPHHRRRAFSLIEAAIVLGIIGLVIGGIWVAASAVTRANKRDMFRQDLFTVFSTLQSKYKGLNMGSGVTIDAPTLAVLFKNNSLMTSSGGITTPWGANAIVSGGIIIDNTRIYMDTMLPTAECIYFGPLLNNASLGMLAGADGSSISTPAQAASGCRAVDGNYVDGWVLFTVSIRR